MARDVIAKNIKSPNIVIILNANDTINPSESLLMFEIRSVMVASLTPNPDGAPGVIKPVIHDRE